MRHLSMTGVVGVFLTVAATPATAQNASRVSLTIGTEKGLPVSATQQWYRTLTELGVDQLRIRARRPGEQPAIRERYETRPGARPAAPTYLVTGIIDSRNRLLVPGGTFHSRDVGKIKSWLTKLRGGGVSAATGQPPAPFGLSSEQLKRVRDDLALPLGFSTRGISTRDALEKAASQLKFPLAVQPDAATRLAAGGNVTEELRELSTGTAIAYLLRRPGLVLIPSGTGRGRPSYSVRRPRANEPSWPVGREPKKKRTELMPELFEILTVELDDIPVSQVLDAVGGRLKLPVLLDHYALVLHGIDPAAARVNLPEKRTSYSVVLRQALGQAKLKSQLRVDDADRPFLWVTTFKPAD